MDDQPNLRELLDDVSNFVGEVQGGKGPDNRTAELQAYEFRHYMVCRLNDCHPHTAN